ncbi:MAG: BlaI/MecI/CopY family transcriptional regulator [Acidobacteriota bacterium]
MVKATLGEQELALLRWVAEYGPLTVGEALERFGEQHGYARTTVTTMLERLRKKGYLVRRSRQGINQYASKTGHKRLLHEQVERFVERTLEGSVSPLVAYLSESRALSPEEVQQLESLVDRLSSKPRG